MRWILWGLAGLVVIGVFIAIIGAMLPQNHSAERKARFKASPEQLFAVISGPPTWRPEVKNHGDAPPSEGRPRWWEEDSHGEKITYEVSEEQPPTRRVTKIVSTGLPYGGSWTVDINRLPQGGSEIRIREDGQIYNPIFRFVARYFIGYTSTIEGYLNALAKSVGESVQVEA